MNKQALPDNFNWSFSKLMVFESCPLRFKFKYIDRVPELPPKPDNPMERGNREHKLLEDFVTGRRDNIRGCEGRATEDFLPLLQTGRELVAAEQGTAEQNWFFDTDWTPTTRDNVWLWLKLDLFVHDNDTAVIVDYKTGKSVYKAVEHAQQLQLYAPCVALKFPEIRTIHTELWYLDEGHVKHNSFSHEEALGLIRRYDDRVQTLYNTRLFRANPSKMNCRYCPFGPNVGTGHCPSAAR